jgi:hypothetical protein
MENSQRVGTRSFTKCSLSELLIPVNQVPESYYEVKVEGGNIAPLVPPIATEQDNLKQQNDDLKKQLEDYKALTEERFNKLVALIQGGDVSKK